MNEPWYLIRSDEELRKESIIDEGDYDFEVLNAERKLSKAGNYMIELKLKIFDSSGRERQLRDWLLEMEGFRYRIKQFCLSVGLFNEYENGTFDGHLCIGKTGKLSLSIGKDKNNEKQNRVKSYISLADAAFQKEKPLMEKHPEHNDDVPF